jgi:hypothetical protein
MVDLFPIVVSVLVLLTIYVAVPAVIVRGWAQWWRRTEPRTFFSALPALGVALAAASGLVVLHSIVAIHVAGGGQFYDLRVIQTFRWGSALAVSGLLVTIIGALRPGPLRWIAPCYALVNLFFWYAIGVSY